MTELEIGQVKKAVYSWSIMFKEAVRTNDELLILSEEYFDNFLDENVSHNEFDYARKQAQRKCGFFPKMCDILKYVDEYRKNPPVSYSLQLEEHSGHEAPMTDEQATIMRKRLDILARISCGEITHEHGAIQMENLQNENP